MNKVTLQVPINKTLKLSAEKEAIAQGFSSLQETIRVFLSQLAARTITIQFATPDEKLTVKQEAILTRKYQQVKKDIAAGEGFIAHSVDEMMQQLRS